jgi:TRAP-type C4-dicarboxylate transport system substrate-binding protein
MKRNGYFLGVVIFLCIGFISAQMALAEPIKLKAVCFLPKNHPIAAPTLEWVNRVNKMFPEDVKIDYLGGPEIISSVEQVEALRKGIVDINFNVGSYYAPHGAEFNSLQLSKLLPADEKKSGYYDYMVKAHEKIGIKFLVRWQHLGFYMYSKQPINTIDEIKGKKIRTGPLYVFFLHKLGASPVSINPSDVYTSLERGLVEGFCWPLIGSRELGWTNQCKYIVDIPFYESSDNTILVNLKKWETLPADVKDKMVKMVPDYESWMLKYWDDEGKKTRDLMEKDGIKFIKFDPKEQEKYVTMAYSAWWEFLQTKVPDLVPQLKKMTGN